MYWNWGKYSQSIVKSSRKHTSYKSCLNKCICNHNLEAFHSVTVQEKLKADNSVKSWVNRLILIP